MNRYAEQLAAGQWSTYWVCTDCMLTLANGECGPDSDREPLSLIPDTADVSLGLMTEEHSEYCTPEDRAEGCDCDHNTFSKSSCDGCGTCLAGERHAVTVVYDMHESCAHVWVAGMCYVSEEDVATVSSVRPVTCERCDETRG